MIGKCSWLAHTQTGSGSIMGYTISGNCNDVAKGRLLSSKIFPGSQYLYMKIKGNFITAKN